MGSDRPERIEIELTSHAPDDDTSRRRWWSRRTQPDIADVEVDSADRPGLPDLLPVTGSGPTAGPSSDGRSRESLVRIHRRTVVVAGVVGVAALLLGWMLGRSGGDDAAVTGDRSPTTPESRSEPTASADVDQFPEIIVEPDDANPDRRRATSVPTGSTAPVDAWGPVEIAPELRGIDLVLVGVTLEGGLVDLDLSTGARRDRRPAGVARDVPQIYAGSSWVGVPAANGSGLRIIHDDGSEDLVSVADPWSVIYDPTTETFWIDSNRGSSARQIDEFDVSGEPTGRSVTLPGGAWPVTTDRGALVVRATGMLYRVTPDGSEVLARGELAGISDDRVATFSCDESLRCGIELVDRASGETRRLSADPTASDADSAFAASGFAPGIGAGVSPDGRWVTGARHDSARIELGLLELDTGTFVAIPGPEFPPSAVWSPDGRYLIYPGAGRLLAFDTTDRETFDVLTESQPWAAITARPRSAIADELVEG